MEAFFGFSWIGKEATPSKWKLEIFTDKNFAAIECQDVIFEIDSLGLVPLWKFRTLKTRRWSVAIKAQI